MRSFSSPEATCPFNKAHKMPQPRFIWHITRCKARKERLERGLKEYHCKHNWNHIFLTPEDHEVHEKICGEAEAHKNE